MLTMPRVVVDVLVDVDDLGDDLDGVDSRVACLLEVDEPRRVICVQQIL